MECQNTIKSLKINIKKNIGSVLIIVEGQFEFDLLKHIFVNILHYKYIEKSRNQKIFKSYDKFVMKGNENSSIIVINSKNSNLSSIKKDKDYLNELFKYLYVEYGIDIKNIHVYFIWDRDNKSNPVGVTKELLSKFGNSLENKNEEMNGLLLLSYPCIESYIISNFDNKTLFLKEKNLKNYIKDKNYKIQDIDKNKLLKATAMMNKALINLGINEYNLDDFSITSLKIFEKQEYIYNNKNYYNLLSLISIILLDLNIITIRNTN